MPTAAESMPLGDYIASLKGDDGQPLYSSEQAAMYGGMDQAVKSGQISPYDLVRSAVTSPAVPAKVQPTSAEQAMTALREHEQQQLAQDLDATFAGAAAPHDYHLPEPSGGHTPETMEMDSAVRGSLHQAGFPVWAAESIGKGIADATRQMAGESQADRTTRDQAADARLHGLWGSDYDANLVTVHRYLDGLRQRSSQMKQFIDNNLPALGRDPLSVDVLLQIAKHGNRS